MNRSPRLLLAAVSLLAAGSALAADNVFGLSFDGKLYRWPNGGGSGVLVAATGLASLNSFFCWHGHFYTVDTSGTIWGIDVANGQRSQGASLDFGGKTDVRALAADLAEETWFVVDGGVGEDELWRLPPLSGTPIFVGRMGRTTIQGLTITRNDDCYAWDVNSAGTAGLLRVDRTTGATTDVSAANGGGPQAQDLYSFGNAVRAVRNDLFAVNQADGSLTSLGVTGISDIRGASMAQFGMRGTPALQFGQVVEGNAASLWRKDGNFYRVRKFIVPNPSVDPIMFEVRTNLPPEIDRDTVEAVSFNFSGRMETAGAFRLVLEVLNHRTGFFENVATQPVGTSDLLLNHAVGALNRINPSNQVVWRIRVRPTGPVANPQFVLRTDYCGLGFDLED